MIIRGGENVYSLAVETALAAHPDIAEVAVVGVPDPVFDQRVRAVVVLRPDAALIADAMRPFAATLLVDFEVPAEFRLVDASPHNQSGTVVKRDWRWMTDVLIVGASCSGFGIAATGRQGLRAADRRCQVQREHSSPPARRDRRGIVPDTPRKRCR
jgi:hypothetical protein